MERQGPGGRRTGFLFNLYLWKYVPNVSWLWWNVIGFVISFGIGYLLSFVKKGTIENFKGLVWHKGHAAEFGLTVNWGKRYVVLGVWAVFILVVSAFFGMR